MFEAKVKYYSGGTADYSRLPAKLGTYLAELDGQAGFYAESMRINTELHKVTDHVVKYGQSWPSNEVQADENLSSPGKAVRSHLPTLRTQLQCYLKGKNLRCHATLHGFWAVFATNCEMGLATISICRF